MAVVQAMTTSRGYGNGTLVQAIGMVHWHRQWHCNKQLQAINTWDRQWQCQWIRQLIHGTDNGNYTGTGNGN